MDVSSIVELVGTAIVAGVSGGGVVGAVVRRRQAAERNATELALAKEKSASDRHAADEETGRVLVPRLLGRIDRLEEGMDALRGKYAEAQDDAARCKSDLYDLTGRLDRSLAETLGQLDETRADLAMQSDRVRVLEERSATCAFRAEPGAACAGSDPPEAGEE